MGPSYRPPWPPWPPWRPHHKPEKPGVPFLYFDFRYYPSEKEFIVTGTVTPSPAVATDQDNDIQIIVSLNGGANDVLDCGAPPGTPVTFPCNAGDTYVITQVDYNVVGASPASAPLTGTVPTIPTPPTGPPTQPGTPTVTFAN